MERAESPVIMKRFFKSILPKSTFARGVSVLVGGTAGSQILLIASSPILTRLYSPDDFGVFAVYGSILALCTVVSSLRYHNAIPLPEDTTEAYNLVLIGILSVVVLAMVSLLLILFGGQHFANLLNTPRLSKYLWILPIGIVFSGFYQVFYFWAVRTKHFGLIAKTKLRQSLVTLGIQIFGSGFGVLALVIGSTLGQGVGNMALGRLILKKHHAKKILFRDLLATARRYSDFPLYSIWSSLFNSAGIQLLPILFTALFNPTAAGLYALANRVLKLPMTIIGEAVGNVFFSNAAEAHREGKLASLVINVHDRLAQIAMAPLLLLLIGGPHLFSLIFGSEWEQAGKFAQWMAPWLYLVFITSPLSHLFSVLEKQKEGLVFQTLLFVTRIGSIIMGAKLGGMLFTVALFSIASTLCWIGFLVWVIHQSGNTTSTLLKSTFCASTWGIVLTAPVTIGYLLLPNSPLVLSSLFLLSLLLIGLRYATLYRKAFI